MTTFSPHLYRGPADLQAMLALSGSRPVAWLLDYPSPADLRELLLRAPLREATCLWETGEGQTVGYALFNSSSTYANLAFEYAAELEDSDLASQMITWGLSIFREQYHGQALELWSSTRLERIGRVRLLEAHGFQRDPESQLLYARDLEEAIPAPVLAPGFTIRPSTGEAEVEAWVRMHRAAFGTQNMTIEDRLAILHVPDYEPDLDLVAVAPGGDLAAYVVGAIHPDENRLTGSQVGFTDPVATHPRYQRLGLARALLCECLRRLRSRGMTSARLGTSSHNNAMQRTAASAGFRQVGEVCHFSKAR